MKKQYIIPIFVPHLGCPNDCIFCNQKSISGQKKQITKEETICIGDNVNDYEMVKNSGLGIAMKNSALEKEKIAKYITEDNNSNGVGNAIFKYDTIL